MNQCWYDNIHVVVNCTYGDPLIPIQIDNTIDKLKSLKSHKASISVNSKAPYNKKILSKLEEVQDNKNIIIFYTLTGLQEGGFLFENRVKFISELCKRFPVAITPRPIIKNRNDSEKNLERIVKVAKEYDCNLVLCELSNETATGLVESNIQQILQNLCDIHGVKSFNETGCCAAFMRGEPCWVHNKTAPGNLDVLASLGIDFELVDNKVVLKRATVGDMNFVRLVTGTSDIYCEELINKAELLSVEHKDGTRLVSSPNHLLWSSNLETCIGCDYCKIMGNNPLQNKKLEVGCHPARLSEYFNKNIQISDRDNKKAKKANSLIGFKDLENETYCRTRYSS